MEFFRNTNIDFLGKKWYFLSFSLIFSVAGILSMLVLARHSAGRGFPRRHAGLCEVCDMRRITRRFAADLDKAGLHNAVIQRYGKLAAMKL